MARRKRKRVDPAAARQAMAQDSRTGGRYLDLEEGTTQVRILPRWTDDGDPRFYRKMMLHYGFIKDGERRALHCLEFEFDQVCPVCVCNAALVDEESSSPARKRFIANVIPTGSGERPRVQILGFGSQVMNAINKLASKPGYGDVTDEETGWDLYVERTGSGRYDTNYSVMPVPNSQGPISIENWDEVLHDLDKEVTDKFEDYDTYLKLCRDRWGNTVGPILFNLATIPREARREPPDEDQDQRDQDQRDEEPKAAQPLQTRRWGRKPYAPPVGPDGQPLVWDPNEDAWWDQETDDLYDEDFDPKYGPPTQSYLKSQEEEESEEEESKENTSERLRRGLEEEPRPLKKKTKRESKKTSKKRSRRS